MLEEYYEKIKAKKGEWGVKESGYNLKEHGKDRPQ